MNIIDYNNDNTLICTIARMNPPTPGHLYVIRKLIEDANSKGVDNVYVILSKSNDDKKNPITCEAKKFVLGERDYLSSKDLSKKMINSLKTKMINEAKFNQELSVGHKSKLISQIENINVNLICVPEEKGATPFTPIKPLILKMKNTSTSCLGINLFIVIGEDRRDMLYSLSNQYFKMDEVNSVDGSYLPRKETEECAESDQFIILNVKTKPEMSATYIRDLVKKMDIETFNKIYDPYLDKNSINNLFAIIQEGIQMKSPVQAKTKSSVVKVSTKKKLSPLPFPHVKRYKADITPSGKSTGGKNKRTKRNYS